MNKLLLVSNRLPVTVEIEDGTPRVHWSGGGLATGLRGVHEGAGSEWIGWPGTPDQPDDEQRETINRELAGVSCSAVYLSTAEVHAFYEQVSNGVLWPAFHYHLDRIPAEIEGWETFVEVNQRFAEAAAARYQPGDIIWVHDYQLCLVPGMLRKLLPDAAIGFFLHIPFPSSEVFSAVPWREELLLGMLGADLIGFHMPAYLRHFATSLRRVLGLEIDIDRVRHATGESYVSAFPMGVDAKAWSALADRPEVVQHAEELISEAQGQRLLVGIDRLDYTKGIPRRVLAVDHLLRLHPELRGQVRLIQVTVPSRESLESYAAFRRDLDELIGRVNATWATEQWVPIHNLHRSMSEDEVAALYRAADVMLVTPMRDGMNLVAKEFVASRTDQDGVLVVSEFAGAAMELGAALHVNPYDVEAMASRIAEALSMERPERERRMRALRLQVGAHDSEEWANEFVERLREIASARAEHSANPTRALASLTAELQEAERLKILLDYDGTLVPLAATPDLAVPDAEILSLLEQLSRRPRTDVHVVSGRDYSTLDGWFGKLNIGLHAEHGLWSRWPGGAGWVRHRHAEVDWKERIRPILARFTRATLGSFIEEKTDSLAWHYRNAKEDFVGGVDFGEAQAKELRLLLVELLSRSPLNVLAGDRVIEIRPQGAQKGAIIPLLLERGGPGRILAFGDDTTDEDMFASLPPDSLTVRVGDGASQARFRVPDWRAVRSVLTYLCVGPHPRLKSIPGGRAGCGTGPQLAELPPVAQGTLSRAPSELVPLDELDPEPEPAA